MQAAVARPQRGGRGDLEVLQAATTMFARRAPCRAVANSERISRGDRRLRRKRHDGFVDKVPTEHGGRQDGPVMRTAAAAAWTL